MQNLTQEGQNLLYQLSSKYRISYDAVLHMLIAVNNGNGTMAQFNCPELGGAGQWMRGGMTMVGDMFNYGLKSTVDNLCNELSQALSTTKIFPSYSNTYSSWYPADLGIPSSSGSQNNIRYAVFPQSRRLAVEYNGQITIYDTLDHSISGVSQQQGGDTSVTFSSQYGTISVNSLPIVSGQGVYQQNTNFASHQQPIQQPKTETIQKTSSNEVIELLEKLKKLYDAGVLSEQEYNTKKSELLNRI